MGIKYSMEVGYGFLLEPIEEEIRAAVMEEKAAQSDDLMLFDIADKLTMQDAFVFEGKFYEENELEACSLEVIGDHVSGEEYSFVAQLISYETFSLDGNYSNEAGARLFDDEIPISAGMKRDIEKFKKYFRLLNDEPKPIASIRVTG